MEKLGDLSRVEDLLESSLSENADNHRLQPLQGRTGLKLQGYIHVQSAAHGKNMGIIIEIIASNITKPIHRDPKYPASNFVENIHFTVIKSYKMENQDSAAGPVADVVSLPFSSSFSFCTGFRYDAIISPLDLPKCPCSLTL